MYGKFVSVLVCVILEVTAIQVAENGRIRRSRIRHDLHNSSLDSPSLRRPCDTDQIEYRLTRLEIQMAEKSENLYSELKESNRRLQALEWQSSEVETALETFRNELGRFTDVQQTGRTPPPSPISNKLDLRIDNLGKGLQLVVTALKSINSDIGTIKRNISTIAKNTKSLVLNHDELVTKPFLTDSLVDVKHHHVSQSSPERSRFQSTSQDLPQNCKEVQERGNNVSGIYRIHPELAPRAFMVLCDMRTRGGGWTYIHNRYEGVQDFYLNWRSYKLGFGNLGGEFWLGLEYLHQLTGYEVNELLIELVDVEEMRVHAEYGAFSVGSEIEGYALKVLGGYKGNAGDSLIYHAGSKFSTKDMDQDEWPEGSCAQAHNGAWWYRSCDTSNLNGKYFKGELPSEHLYQGMYWGDFHGAQYSLLRARMMIRPRDTSSPALSSN